MRLAQQHALECLAQGHVPFSPHWAFNWLEGQPYGHELAIYLCLRWIEMCDEVWYWGPVSEGMRVEIAYAKGIGKEVKEML